MSNDPAVAEQERDEIVVTPEMIAAGVTTFARTVADQSACPSCVDEAARALTRPDTPEQQRRRWDRWA